jgi:hypothetical protein
VEKFHCLKQEGDDDEKKQEKVKIDTLSSDEARSI